MPSFIIFDTEYASWKGFIDLPAEKQKGVEIVQISAIKVNLSDLSVAEELNIYIKPHFTPKLTEYFINLTGITDDILDAQGTNFPTAYQYFKKFSDNLPCYSHSWSLSEDFLADGKVMNDNLALFAIKETSSPDYRNIANWFKKVYAEKNIPIKKQSSGQIAKLLGCEKEISQIGLNEHNAIYDVYSILAGLRFFGFKELI